jgi:DtxR family Mn-dependent transcriptional regulator
MRHAVDLTRRHRLWEVFLIERLGFEWDEVHAIADELEHVGSGDMIDRLEAYLGNPTHDPHGDVIPRRDGTVRRRSLVAVSALSAGEGGVIARVQDEIPELLRYASTLGLEIGTKLAVLERIEFDGSVRVAAGRGEAVISGKLAESIWLERSAAPRRARRRSGR